jgi:hypothetical protein
MGIATAIALVGNVQVALPGHVDSPFAWLEAIAPPLLVLSTAYVLKEQLLETIEVRHANERAYQEAVSAWQLATVDPESHPGWLQYYANALRDALRRSNARRREALEALTTADWRALVERELQADDWFSAPTVAPEAEAQEQASAPRPFAISANGHHPQTDLLTGGA